MGEDDLIKPQATVAPPPSVPLELDALFRAYAERVAAWATYLGGPLVDPEDVVQEVFLTVGRLLPSFHDEAGVRPWIYRITANTARHQRRKARLRRYLRGGSDEVAGQLASARPTALEEMERRETLRTVRRVLDRLSERERRLLVLFEIEGASGQEVALALAAPLGSVWVWLHRARAQFARELAREHKRQDTRRAR